MALPIATKAVLDGLVNTPANLRDALASAQFFPIVHIDVSLMQDTSQRAYRNLRPLWDYRGIHGFTGSAHEFDVTALLTRLSKSRCLKSALDFAEGLRLKPPQPRPRQF